MKLLDPTWIRDNVDYSFGDDSGLGIGGYVKVPNIHNHEFLHIYQQAVSNGKEYMTLFIDNMRLYRRDCYRYTAVEQHNPTWRSIRDQKVLQYADHDLLRLCAGLPDMKFIIFTGFEDMPIDEGIWNALPPNVLGVFACNCMVWGERVYPIPFGLQRVLAPNDARLCIIEELMNSPQVTPRKLLYLNFNVGNHPTRGPLATHYKQFHWATVQDPGRGLVTEPDCRQYYGVMRDHKFMLCPSGNAEGCECHRDWECLYMRRVPIVTDTEYHRIIFKDIPVLYVNDLLHVTEQLLIDNDYLYQQMQSFDMSKLDIEVLYNNCINKVTQPVVI